MDYPMHPDLEVGSQFPDFELPDQDDKMQQLSKLIRLPHGPDLQPRIFTDPSSADDLCERAAVPRQLLQDDHGVS